MDSGAEAIEDDAEKGRVRQQALRVHARAWAAAIAGTVVVVALGALRG